MQGRNTASDHYFAGYSPGRPRGGGR